MFIIKPLYLLLLLQKGCCGLVRMNHFFVMWHTMAYYQYIYWSYICVTWYLCCYTRESRHYRLYILSLIPRPVQMIKCEWNQFQYKTRGVNSNLLQNAVPLNPRMFDPLRSHFLHVDGTHSIGGASDLPTDGDRMVHSVVKHKQDNKITAVLDYSSSISVRVGILNPFVNTIPHSVKISL